MKMLLDTTRSKAKQKIAEERAKVAAAVREHHRTNLCAAGGAPKARSPTSSIAASAAAMLAAAPFRLLGRQHKRLLHEWSPNAAPSPGVPFASG